MIAWHGALMEAFEGRDADLPADRLAHHTGPGAGRVGPCDAVGRRPHREPSLSARDRRRAADLLPRVEVATLPVKLVADGLDGLGAEREPQRRLVCLDGLDDRGGDTGRVVGWLPARSAKSLSASPTLGS